MLNVTKLYMTGFAGSLGAARFASENMNLLRSRFREDYIKEQMKILFEDTGIRDYAFDGNGFDSSEALDLIRTATDEPESIVIIDEIYRIAHEEKKGLEVNLRDIPIRQFTIEVCELAGLDPYHLETRAHIRLGDTDMATESYRVIGKTYDGLDVVLVRN